MILSNSLYICTQTFFRNIFFTCIYMVLQYLLDLQKQNNKTTMELQVNNYHVDVNSVWIVPTRNGYEARFQVYYDDKYFVAGHAFNDPLIYSRWKRYDESSEFDSAEHLLVEEFWMYIQDNIASQIEDHEESKSITTPKAKRDARYYSEN